MTEDTLGDVLAWMNTHKWSWTLAAALIVVGGVVVRGWWRKQRAPEGGNKVLDEAEAGRIRENWNEVVRSYSAIRAAQMAGMSGGMFGFPHAVLKLADVAYCMLVFMAFSTLELFLGARESAISLTKKEQSQGLKKLIRESKKLRNGVAALEWTDDKLVDEGRELRDKLAHHHLTEKRAITLTYVKAVQDELAGWLDGLEMIDFSAYTQLKRWKR